MVRLLIALESVTVFFGYEAEDVIGICDAYLKARLHKKLHPTQYHLAEQSEMFIRSCAKVGLVALIDEATGYQDVRDADDLQVKIAAYISGELSEWTKTFPDEFFNNLYRLEGQPIPIPPRPYPKRFGRYVMQFVYDTLDPDVADWLREHNPNPQGKEHHFQLLTREFGQPKLRNHLWEIMGIQKVFTTLENFKENLNRAYTEAREQRRKRLSRQRQIMRRKKSMEAGQTELELEMTYL